MAAAVEEASPSVPVSDDSIPTFIDPIITGSSIPGLPRAPLLPQVPPLPHHAQQPLCLSRPSYRQGRRLTAVKAYTISDESVHLLITGVPGLKLQRELKNLCLKYGAVLCLKRLEDYPVEPFDEAYLVKYGSVREARFAKKMLDGKNFFGGVFHVCYAPELESVDETREKLEERRRAVQFALRKQEREKRRLEDSSEGGGSLLCEYHPDDRLASAIKRVTNHLSYNKGSVNIGPLNLNNSTNADHQAEASLNTDLAGCVSTQLSDNNNGVSHTMAANISTAIARKNMMEAFPHLQNNRLYTVPPPPFQYCAGKNNTNPEPSQVPYVSETSLNQTNGNQSSYPLANASCFPSNDERSDPRVGQPTRPSQESSSATASVGQQYASMNADYEPGLGCTGGERYVASTKKHKRNSFTHKATVKSFTIKPTKAYKRRKIDQTPGVKRAVDGASKPKLGYREVVRSLQQQRVSDGNGQLARLQMALQATLGAPTSQDKVGPAPNRPSAKMKRLDEGVKLL